MCHVDDQPKICTDYLECKFKTLVIIYLVLTDIFARNLISNSDLVLNALSQRRPHSCHGSEVLLLRH